MVIRYDLYGSQRISVSQWVFLQYTLLISFLVCIGVKIQNQDQNDLCISPTRSAKSSMII